MIREDAMITIHDMKYILLNNNALLQYDPLQYTASKEISGIYQVQDDKRIQVIMSFKHCQIYICMSIWHPNNTMTFEMYDVEGSQNSRLILVIRCIREFYTSKMIT